jgi:phosphatidate cytidylyltransferase
MADELEPPAFVRERPPGAPEPSEAVDDRARRPPPPRGPPPAEPRRGSETLARIVWAVPWIAVVVAVVAVGGIVFAVAMVAFGCIGLAELFRMARDYRPFQLVAMVVVAGMVAAAYFEDQDQVVLALAAGFPLMFLATATRESLDGILRSLAVTTFGMVWIGLPFAYAVLLRELPVHGGALLIDVLVATFVADTAAYAGGRLFGRHLLAPTLSPHKTVEGLVFGIVGGTMGFWFAGLYQDWLPGLDALLMGLAVAIMAPVGDLFESMVKRDLGAKDSGDVLGPHGGLLDRVDAALFTILPGYYLAVAFGF